MSNRTKFGVTFFKRVNIFQNKTRRRRCNGLTFLQDFLPVDLDYLSKYVSKLNYYILQHTTTIFFRILETNGLPQAQPGAAGAEHFGFSKTGSRSHFSQHRTTSFDVGLDCARKCAARQTSRCKYVYNAGEKVLNALRDDVVSDENIQQLTNAWIYCVAPLGNIPLKQEYGKGEGGSK